MKIIVLLVSFLFFLTPDVFPQFNHPWLRWRVIETSHFLIYYHQNEKSCAYQAAKVAEDIYPRLTADIGYSPSSKIPIVIKNYNDTTGGYTSIMEQKIVIQAQSDTSQTAGSLPWLREVIGHELTHYISFAAIDESVVALRKVIANLALPMWFIEGLAEYEGEKWHSLKRMVVGDEVREGKILSEGDLGAFYFFDGWGRMSGYYQSDSFVRYIFDTYGKDKIPRIFRELRNQPLIKLVGVISISGGGGLYPVPHFLNFDQALRKAIGKDTAELYEEWRNWIRKKYEKKENGILSKENPLFHWGTRDQHPVFSPEKDKIAFVSDKGYDYAIFDLYLMDLNSKKVKKLVSRINPSFSFSPDGRYIVYSKVEFYPPERAFLSDLYKINVNTGKIKRLTYGKRAFQPSFSPRGDRIVFVRKEGGNSNLYILFPTTGKLIQLTNDRDGLTQNFTPSFSSDGKKIVFVRFEKGKRDIFILNLKDKKMYPLTRDSADDRCPNFSPDGKKIIFVSDREKGVFNLWSIGLKDRELVRYTSVAGGIFDPNFSPDGKKIAISGYKNGVFSIYIFKFKKLKILQKISLRKVEITKKKETSGKKSRLISRFIPPEKSVEMKEYPYKPRIKLHYILPWFSIDEEDSFFSVDFYASDTLEKHQLAGSVYLSDNTQYEILYVNRSFTPTLWTDLYSFKGYSYFKGEYFPVEVSGGVGGMFYPLNDRLSFQLGYSSEYLSTYLFTPSLELVPWKGNIREVELGMTYFNLMPVREPELLPWGKVMDLRLKWSDHSLGSELDYLMGKIDLRDYWRISKNKTLAFRLMGESVKNKQVSPRIVFSLGGWNDLRGYPEGFLTGENIALSSIEYRFNWLRRMGGSSSFYFDSLGGAIFYDMGTSWRQEEKLDKSNMLRDIGTELRLRMLPFGKYSLVMRVGVVWPLDYNKRRGRIFLLFGGIF